MANRARSTNVSMNPTRHGAPRGNFEVMSWFFMRISGLALVFLALIHFSMTHIFTDVTNTTVAYVAKKWSNPFWRVFDWLLLTLGLLHGANGIRYIMDDYIRKASVRALVKALVYLSVVSLFILGTVTIVTFRGSLV